MIATQNSHYDALELLIMTAEVDLNLCTDDGTTAFYLAGQNGQYNIVSLLLNPGADPTLQTNSAWSPLMAASENGHIHIVGVLLKAHCELLFI